MILTVCLAKALPLVFKTLTLKLADFLTFLDTFLVINLDLTVTVFLTLIFPNSVITEYSPGFSVIFK